MEIQTADVLNALVIGFKPACIVNYQRLVDDRSTRRERLPDLDSGISLPVHHRSRR